MPLPRFLIRLKRLIGISYDKETQVKDILSSHARRKRALSGNRDKAISVASKSVKVGLKIFYDEKILKEDILNTRTK